jgi:hypothetical protein
VTLLQLQKETVFRQSSLSLYVLLELVTKGPLGATPVLSPFPAKNRLVR